MFTCCLISAFYLIPLWFGRLFIKFICHWSICFVNILFGLSSSSRHILPMLNDFLNRTPRILSSESGKFQKNYAWIKIYFKYTFKEFKVAFTHLFFLQCLFPSMKMINYNMNSDVKRRCDQEEKEPIINDLNTKATLICWCSYCYSKHIMDRTKCIIVYILCFCS